MSTKHTPGPWERSVEVSEEYYGDWLIIGPARIRIDGKDPNAEEDANASLIATAPELLKALKFHHGHEGLPVSISGTRRHCETCKLIDKAGGK